MKASTLFLMLSWLPSLAAQTLDTERVERAVLPLELAAVNLTPIAPADLPLDSNWGYQPLAETASATPLQAEPVVTAALHAAAAPTISMADLLKSDPLGTVARRSYVPETTATAAFGTAALALLMIGQALRRSRQWA